MKIKEMLYKTPEMTEEKLLLIMESHLDWVKRDLKDRIIQLHKNLDVSSGILNEYDLIQDKHSYLTKSQRDIILGFVGICMIEMVKDDGGQSTE